MELFKSNDCLQLAYICALAGLHAVPTAIVRLFNHDRIKATILCPMLSFLKAVQCE